MFRNFLANNASRFHRADNLAGKDVKFSGCVLKNVERSAILLRGVFDNADDKARPEIDRMFGYRHGECALLSGGLEAAEGNRLEPRPFQEARVMLGNRLPRIRGGPVIR